MVAPGCPRASTPTATREAASPAAAAAAAAGGNIAVMEARQWPRPVSDYCLPADGDVAGWRSVGAPYCGDLELLSASARPLDAARTTTTRPSRRARVKAWGSRALWGSAPRDAVRMRVYLLFGLHWRKAGAGERPPDRPGALWGDGQGEEEATSGFTTVALRRDSPHRKSYDTTLEAADDGSLRVLLLKVLAQPGCRTYTFLADSTAAAAEWHTRLRQRAAPVELFFSMFPLGPPPPVWPPTGAAAGSDDGSGGGSGSAAGRPTVTAVGRHALSAMVARPDTVLSAVHVVAMVASPAAAAAVSAAGPAVGLVVGAVLSAARVAMAVMRSGDAELQSVAHETGTLFDVISGGLLDLLRTLLAADDPPVPAVAKQVLTSLLASLTDRLEGVACAQTAVVRSRGERLRVSTIEQGSVADLLALLAAVRGDVQLLLGLIGARTMERLVVRQQEVLDSLATSDVGTLYASLSGLLSSLVGVASDLGSTASRMEVAAGEMKKVAAVERAAEIRTLATYASLLSPLKPDDGIVVDWEQPSRPECRTYAAILGTSPAPLAVGVTGMGGMGKSTTLQLVCARLIEAANQAGARFPGAGRVVWLQLHRDVSDAEAKTLLLRAVSHLQGRVVDEAVGMLQAASMLGAAAVAAARDGRPVLLALDDVWDARLVQALRSALRRGAGGGQPSAGRRSMLLFSARAAAMATSDGETVRVALERMDEHDGLHVLASAVAGVAGHPPLWVTDAEQRAAKALVAFADGHPLTLCVAGSLARTALADDTLVGGLTEALVRLRYKLEEISGSVGAAYGSHYPSLWASMLASYESLSPTCRAQFRALAVMRTKGRLPLVALGALWGVPAPTAMAIAKTLADASMATVRPGRSRASGGAAQPSGPTLVLHDITLQFATELCAAEDGGVAGAHDALLRGYAKVYGLDTARSSVVAASGCVDGVRPWWEVVQDDEYMAEELCRHLAAAQRHTELRLLLYTWAYVEAQVGWGRSAAFPSTARYVADCSLDKDAWPIAAVVEGAALRGGVAQVVFELDARFSAAARDCTDDRGSLLGRLLAGARAAYVGTALRLVAPQSVLEPPLVRRYYVNASVDDGGVNEGGGHPVGVTCTARLPPAPPLVDGGDSEQRLAVGGVDGHVRIFDVGTGKVTATLRSDGVKASSVGLGVRDLTPHDRRDGHRPLSYIFYPGPLEGVRCVVAVAGGVTNASGEASTAVLSVSVTGECCVWAVDSAKLVHTLCDGAGRASHVLCVAVLDELRVGGSEEGCVPPAGPVRVVSGSLDGNVRIWDVRRGTCEAVLRHAHPVDDQPRGWKDQPPGRNRPIVQVAVVGGGGSSDGLVDDHGGSFHRRLVTMTMPHKLFVWGEGRDGWVVERELEMMEPISSPFLCLTSVTPQTIAAASDPSAACALRCASTSVALVRDASSHTSTASKTVDGYDVATGERVCRATTEADFQSCAVLPRRSAAERSRFAPRAHPLVLACGDTSGGVSLWNPSRAAFSTPVGAHKGEVTALVVVDLPSGAEGRSAPAKWPVLVSASSDGTLAVWDSSMWTFGRSAPRHAVKRLAACLPPALRVACDPPATGTIPCAHNAGGSAFLVVTADERVAVRRWGAPEETAVEVPLPLLGDVSPLDWVCFQPAMARLPSRNSCVSPVLVAASVRGGAWVWNEASGVAAILEPQTAAGKPLQLAVIPAEEEGEDGMDGRCASPLVVALSASGVGHVWDGHSRRTVAAMVPPFPLELRSLTTVGVARCAGDGYGGHNHGRDRRPPLVVGACSDGRMVVWDAPSGEHVCTMGGDPLGSMHFVPVMPVAAEEAPPGHGGHRRRAVVTIVNDRCVRASGRVATVWDVDTGDVVATMDGPLGFVTDIVAFEAGGGVEGDPVGPSRPSPCLVVVAVDNPPAVYVWTVAATVAASPAPVVAAAVAPRPVPQLDGDVVAVAVLDAGRGLFVAHLRESVAVLAVSFDRPGGPGAVAAGVGAVVIARVALLGLVRQVQVVDPRAVAVVVGAGSLLVQLELVRGART
ncbi:hypothetical protein MMPV_004199 [Pyropia vietnamensis]